MKSKSLFFKLMKEDLKRRIWTVALSILVLFIVLPIFCALQFESYTYSDLSNDQIKQLIQFIGPSNGMVIFITVISAIVCGLSGFFYLQSRKKVDLYHSIPVRRESLFAVSYINGVIIYLIPYIINVLVSIIIMNKNHLLNDEILHAAVYGILIHILFFCMIYTTTIIAVMLTGNIIVSCLGTAVFLLYGPALLEIKNLYYSGFFTTYFNVRNKTEILGYLSPLGSYISIAGEYTNGGINPKSIIISIIVTFALISIALLLYKKRPSEASGKAMVFWISKPIISYLLVSPIALGGGIFFRSLGSNNQDSWFLFGLIFSLIIAYAIIQVIYNFDIRSILHNKLHLLICFVITASIASAFYFDLFHYDSYMPKKDNIKSMSVSISGIDQNLNYMEYSDGIRVYHDRDTYHLDKMKLTNDNAAYLLAKKGIESKLSRNDLSKSRRGLLYYNNNSSSNFYDYIVKYNLTSGKEVYRHYSIPKDNNNLLNEIYVQKEFKEVHFPLYQWNEDDIDQIAVSYNSEILNYMELGSIDRKSYNSFNVDIKDLKQFIRIYKDELYNLSLDEMANNYPVVKLTFKINNDLYENYNVYPSFKETLKYLNEHGFDTSKTVKNSNIADISVVNLNRKSELINRKEGIASPEETLTYKDQKDILAILPYIVQSDYYSYNNAILNVDDSLRVIVNFKAGAGDNVNSLEYYFYRDQVPNFIKTDIKYKK